MANRNFDGNNFKRVPERGALSFETKGTYLVDTQLKQTTDFKLKNAVSPRKSRDHHRYSTSTPLRHSKRGLAKSLPIAIHTTDLRTNYPVEVEELCQVLESMLQRRLAELNQESIVAEENALAA